MYDFIDFDLLLEPLRKMTSSISEQIINFNRIALEKMVEPFKDLIERIGSYYSIEDIEKYKFVNNEMRKFGWTISFKNPNVELLFETINCYKSKCISRDEYIIRIDEVLLGYVEDYDLKQIEDILTIVPERTNIITGAFELFKNEEYDTCIPLLLIQADGLSRDILRLNSGLSIYSKRNYDSKIRMEIHKQFNRELEDKEDILARMIQANIAVFDNYSESMSAKANCIESLFDEEKIHSKFSRHAVLHGIDSNYGNKLNAAKCVSFFLYLEDALPILMWLHDTEDEVS